MDQKRILDFADTMLDASYADAALKKAIRNREILEIAYFVCPAGGVLGICVMLYRWGFVFETIYGIVLFGILSVGSFLLVSHKLSRIVETTIPSLAGNLRQLRAEAEMMLGRRMRSSRTAGLLAKAEWYFYSDPEDDIAWENKEPPCSIWDSARRDWRPAGHSPP